MKIAFIGIGHVGFAIANNLQKNGHQIVVENNDPGSGSVKKALAANPAFTVKKIQDAVDESEVVFLATPYQANQTALEGIRFNGKTLIDCTNPVGPGIASGTHDFVVGKNVPGQWSSPEFCVGIFRKVNE